VDQAVDHGCGGFALGVLLGPIGPIIALVRAPNRETMEAKTIAEGQGKKCPFCAEVMGMALSPVEALPPSLPAGPEAPAMGDAERPAIGGTGVDIPLAEPDLSNPLPSLHRQCGPVFRRAAPRSVARAARGRRTL